MTSGRWGESWRGSALRSATPRELVWLLPILVIGAVYFSPHHIASPGTVTTGLAGLLVVLIAARRPDLSLLGLIIFLPFQGLLLSKLWAWGMPTSIVSHLGAWKEALALGVIVAGVRNLLATGRRLDTVDRLALAFVAFTLLYAAVQTAIVPEAPSASNVRLLGFRETSGFVLLLFGARHAPLGPAFGRRVARVLLVVGALVLGNRHLRGTVLVRLEPLRRPDRQVQRATRSTSSSTPTPANFFDIRVYGTSVERGSSGSGPCSSARSVAGGTLILPFARWDRTGHQAHCVAVGAAGHGHDRRGTAPDPDAQRDSRRARRTGPRLRAVGRAWPALAHAGGDPARRSGDPGRPGCFRDRAVEAWSRAPAMRTTSQPRVTSAASGRGWTRSAGILSGLAWARVPDRAEVLSEGRRDRGEQLPRGRRRARDRADADLRGADGRADPAPAAPGARPSRPPDHRGVGRRWRARAGGVVPADVERFRGGMDVLGRRGARRWGSRVTAPRSPARSPGSCCSDARTPPASFRAPRARVGRPSASRSPFWSQVNSAAPLSTCRNEPVAQSGVRRDALNRMCPGSFVVRRDVESGVSSQARERRGYR